MYYKPTNQNSVFAHLYRTPLTGGSEALAKNLRPDIASTIVRRQCCLLAQQTTSQVENATEEFLYKNDDCSAAAAAAADDDSNKKTKDKDTNGTAFQLAMINITLSIFILFILSI